MTYKTGTAGFFYFDTCSALQIWYNVHKKTSAADPCISRVCRLDVERNIRMRNLKTRFHLNTLFYFTVFLAILIFVLLQPFGDPPDEVNRFKVAQFICRYGKLPTGEEFEVAIGGYGGSYAFQPILPYMIQGILMRFLSLFTTDNTALLLCARMVNAVFGVIMAVFVRRLSLLLFPDKLTGWLFSFLVMFLPQNLFLHSYVNTDSMASMAGAVILYACVSGWKSGWKWRDCITLCAGIVCCALSYYNAYGLIAAAIFFFVFSHFKRARNGRLSIDWRPLLQKGLFISLIVLLGIGWWFVRNYRIHDGDLLGLRARAENAMRTALPEYSPATRVTVAGSGVSLTDMLLHSDFLYYLWNSFVARFGPMTIPTLPFLYIWYYRIFGVGWLCSLLPARWCACADPQKSGSRNRPAFSRVLFHLPLLLAVLIPAGLCIYYSYTSDYQPQGRYIMPMLIPFMYFTALGFHKLTALTENCLCPAFLRKFCRPVAMGAVMTFLLGALLLTLSCVVIPHYLKGANLWNSAWIAL